MSKQMQRLKNKKMKDENLLDKLRKQQSAPEKAENKVERKRFVVYHDDEELRVMFPTYKGSYYSLRAQIQNDGYSMANFAETIDILHSVFESQENEISQKIISSVFNSPYILSSDGILHVPKQGIYIDRNPKLVNGDFEMNRNKLMARLKAQDEDIGFAKVTNYPGQKLCDSQLMIAMLKNEKSMDRFTDFLNYFNVQEINSCFPVDCEQIVVLYLDVGPSRLKINLDPPDDFNLNYAFAIDKSSKVEKDVKPEVEQKVSEKKP
jgi:hypothetical protein